MKNVPTPEVVMLLELGLRACNSVDEAGEVLMAKAGVDIDEPVAREFIEFHRWGPKFRETFQVEPGVFVALVLQRGDDENVDTFFGFEGQVFPHTEIHTVYRPVQP